ncbi:MAG: NAD(P)-dependent oxidoreductase [Desulfobacteraceae bacterium]|nr:MAG: NAD(P)-dependent oxidoreductase [Desulfobacteraceae bacterium]
MNVLVTGAAGFMGSRLLQDLARINYKEVYLKQ